MRPPERTSSSSLRAIGARECGLAVRDAGEEVDQPAGRLGLEQIAGRAAPDRGEEVLLGPGGGEHDDLAFRSGLADPWKGGEAVHSGHGEVEQHEVRPERRACSSASAPSAASPTTENPFWVSSEQSASG